MAAVAADHDRARTWEQVFDACLHDGGVASASGRAAIVSRVRSVLHRMEDLSDAASLDEILDELRETNRQEAHNLSYAWRKFTVAALTFGARVADRVAVPTNTGHAIPYEAIAPAVARLYTALRHAHWVQHDLVHATWGLLSWTADGTLLVPGYFSASRRAAGRAIPMACTAETTDDLFEIIRWGYPGRVPEGDAPRAARLQALGERMYQTDPLLVRRPVRPGSVAAPQPISREALSATIRRGRVGGAARQPFEGYEPPPPAVGSLGSSQVKGAGAAPGAAAGDVGDNGAAEGTVPFGPPELSDLFKGN